MKYSLEQYSEFARLICEETMTHRLCLAIATTDQGHLSVCYVSGLKFRPDEGWRIFLGEEDVTTPRLQERMLEIVDGAWKATIFK